LHEGAHDVDAHAALLQRYERCKMQRYERC
jgi:hypothetical protein